MSARLIFTCDACRRECETTDPPPHGWWEITPPCVDSGAMVACSVECLRKIVDHHARHASNEPISTRHALTDRAS